MTTIDTTPDSEQAAVYWRARQALAQSARELNRLLVSTNLTPTAAEDIGAQIDAINRSLRHLPQIGGLLEMGQQPDRGSIDTIMGEMVAMAGRSHPCAPALAWEDGVHRVTGTVVFDQSFEGPPGAAHGGWVAGVLDHLMGMTHVRMGHPGMTGGLSVRYLRPTPLNETIELWASADPIDDKRTQVKAEMRFAEQLTASAEAVFYRVDSSRFGFDRSG